MGDTTGTLTGLTDTDTTAMAIDTDTDTTERGRLSQPPSLLPTLRLRLILGTDTTGTDTDLTDTDTTDTGLTDTGTTERERLSLPSSLPKVAPTPMPRLIPGMDTMVMDTVPMDMDTTDTVLTDILTGVR